MKNRLGILGFFRKGNCGDEAILHTWYQELKDIIDLYFFYQLPIENESINIHPYDKIKSYYMDEINQIHNNNINYIIIGGGGLGMGYGYKFLLHSKLKNAYAIYAGTQVHDEFFENYIIMDANKSFFKLFDKIYLRDKYSFNNLNEYYGIESKLIPDIAVSLNMEEVIIPSNDYIVVVIRDVGNENNLNDLINNVIEIEIYALNNNLEIIYVPFDTGDLNLLKKLELSSYSEDIFWYPEQVKFIISNSKMVISLGRFHPLVFGLSEGIPSYFINYPKYNKDKSYYILEDVDLSNNYLNEFSIELISIEKTEKLNEIKNMYSKKAKEFFIELKKILSYNVSN